MFRGFLLIEKRKKLWQASQNQAVVLWNGFIIQIICFKINTPKELKKILDKFPKEKVELEKVELGIAQDIAKMNSKAKFFPTSI